MKRNKTRMTERHEDALDRQEMRNELSPKEQLARLDKRLGKAIGAVKERKRLQRLIDNPPKKPKGFWKAAHAEKKRNAHR